MVGKGFDQYMKHVLKLVHSASEKQKGVLEQLVVWMVEAVEFDRRIFVFGAGHASIAASDLFYRAGGLPHINPVFVPGLTLDTRPIDAGTRMERLEGHAPIWLEAQRPRSGEMIIVVSVSGRNAAGVEMAEAAGDAGLRVVGVTSLPYSKSVTSRHRSGRRLFEVCDLVIDLEVPAGDALVPVSDGGHRAGPASTVVATALLNAVVCEVAVRLGEKEGDPPLFASANLPGGDAHNRRLLEQYRDLFTYL